MSKFWLLAEALLIEGLKYYGRGKVRYSELVQLFRYLEGDPQSSIQTWDPRKNGGKMPALPRINYADERGKQHRTPAKEGGYADVNFPFTHIWRPLFSSPEEAIRRALDDDNLKGAGQYPQRHTFTPAKTQTGQRTFAVGTKDLGPRFRGGPSGELRAKEKGVQDEPMWHAQGEELYDFVVEAHESPPEPPKDPRKPARNEPRVVAVRIAWTPAVGLEETRAKTLRDLLAGKFRPSPAPKQELPSNAQPPEPPEPVSQAGNPFAGDTPNRVKAKMAALNAPAVSSPADDSEDDEDQKKRKGGLSDDEWKLMVSVQKKLRGLLPLPDAEKVYRDFRAAYNKNPDGALKQLQDLGIQV